MTVVSCESLRILLEVIFFLRFELSPFFPVPVFNNLFLPGVPPPCPTIFDGPFTLDCLFQLASCSCHRGEPVSLSRYTFCFYAQTQAGWAVLSQLMRTGWALGSPSWCVGTSPSRSVPMAANPVLNVFLFFPLSCTETHHFQTLISVSFTF